MALNLPLSLQEPALCLPPEAKLCQQADVGKKHYHQNPVHEWRGPILLSAGESCCHQKLRSVIFLQKVIRCVFYSKCDICHSQVIFGKSSGPEFLQEVYTPVTYHNK